MKLLSDAESNAKLAKSVGKGYLLASLSLRPANLSGREVCPWRTPTCTRVCVLEHAGRGNMPNVRDARDIKTDRFFDDRANFLADLHADLTWLERKAEELGMIPAVRLNVASDIPWERIDRSLFDAHSTIRFYDYTKGAKRFLEAEKLPANYHLTYSYNELSNPAEVESILRAGGNVAMIFDAIYNPSHGRIDPLPKTRRVPFTSYQARVIDGDASDIRLPELDGTGVIVGLHGKGGRELVSEGVKMGFILATVRGVVASSK